ncbi:Peptidoglycan/LPS O-acetylase OafA/YrhL, contains acyltransferase and SGNH-hydrolase domains [Massilia sp. PDC64]|nr:acyltransferase [Massilia sp. PDC64]SDF17808.1 Peptidoglycan/LPS O-acetylase OafA/YrhL, contains acyltransferase and SGNH-hydrolase domains [Massilia sp. PDC64]
MENKTTFSQPSNVLQPNLSVYLDLLRYFAALMVYLFHAGHFSRYKLPFFGTYGGLGVAVFFVLSGFVIAFSSTGKRRDIVDYFIARFARLWSVALPAILLTLVLDTLGQWLALSAYAPMQPYPAYKWVAASGITALFLNEIWFLDIWLGTNGPFWSLSYEFWYYAIFATLIYFRGWKRVAMASLVIGFAGPGILIAFPVWLLGVGLFHLLRKHAAAGRPLLGAGVLLVSVVGLTLYVMMGGSKIFTALPIAYPLVDLKPWGINFWPQSYMVGFLIALNIYGFARMQQVFRNPSEKVVRLVRTTAETSFGLYLFHYPLMYFCKAILAVAHIPQGTFYVLAIYIAPFIAATWLSLKCEPLKFVLSRVLKTLFKKDKVRPAHGNDVSVVLAGGDRERRIDI